MTIDTFLGSCESVYDRSPDSIKALLDVLMSVLLVVSAVALLAFSCWLVYTIFTTMIAWFGNLAFMIIPFGIMYVKTYIEIKQKKHGSL